MASVPPVYKTISVPVWLGIKDGKEYVYVPSVDVPHGSWVIVMRLTPVDNQLLVLDGSDHEMTNLDITSPDPRITIDEQRKIIVGKGYQLFITNNLTSKVPGTDKQQPPVPIKYGVDVLDEFGKIHHFDPVVIAQPDPVYP